MESVHLQLSEELLAHIDAQRGMVARNRWIRWAIEQALAVKPDLAGEGLALPESRARTSRYPSAPAEQPEAWSQRPDYTMGARSSVQAKRDVRPVPKAKP